MYIKVSNMIKKIVPYRFRLIGIVVGSLGGVGGTVLGFLSGFFIDILLLRHKDEKKIGLLFEKVSSKDCAIDEPFEGALQVCALSVLLIGNPSVAAKQIRHSFPSFSHIDWDTLCRSAFKASLPNLDLVTECLASKLSKYANTQMVSAIFGLLNSIEFGWDDRNGNRPSVYLSELLQITNRQTGRAAAYRILGVNETDSLSVIKSAHRRLAAQYHPDAIKSLSPEQQSIALDAFHRIQKAYEVIIELRSS